MYQPCKYDFNGLYFLIQDLLVTVFENGELVKEYTFEEIRERAELPVVKEARKK